MADNVQLSTNVGTGEKAVTVSVTWSGDTAQLQGVFPAIISGSEGSWTVSQIVGGAGAVAAGVQRITLASDDPAVVALQILDNAISGSEMQVDVVGALPAGTNAIGKLAANSGVDIGDVDVTSVPADPFGVNADAASATGSISAKLRFIASTGIPITGTVTVGSHAVTNAGTFAVQAAQSGTWTVDLGATDNAVLDAIAASLAGTLTVGSHAVTNAGTFVVQVDGTALTRLTDIETNTDSGAVVGNGAAATAQRVSIANDSTGILAGVTTVTTLTTLTGGGIAHDSADSGNPVKIGVKATASVLGQTPVTAADRTDLYAGTDGVLIVRPNCSLEDIISEVKTNTDGASTAMTGAFAATASQRIYLTDLIISNSSASNITVDIRDGSAGSVLATFPVPTVGGVVHRFSTPLRFTANTAAAFDGSAAASTLSVTMIGFKSKA